MQGASSVWCVAQPNRKVTCLAIGMRESHWTFRVQQTRHDEKRIGYRLKEAEPWSPCRTTFFKNSFLTDENLRVGELIHFEIVCRSRYSQLSTVSFKRRWQWWVFRHRMPFHRYNGVRLISVSRSFIVHLRVSAVCEPWSGRICHRSPSKLSAGCPFVVLLHELIH